MNPNDDLAATILQDSFPELFGILAHTKQGHLTMAEVGEVIHKMSIVRSADDGFGKIVLEFREQNGQRILLIKTIQEKMFKTIPAEES